ncbi:DUF4296 domain-containing protein [Roseivirga sp.]|jgi:hypothetical protein|uniref:DUF4296 domain-containing protein n=1 Tax=Roseivirga sp. TaxID=1964215 RepID=UPI000D79B8C8|nr:DUF4296 domain-containing protein [Roseivirga sp.]MBO6494795.1 DUF4296 domain-containing protein [Roseivirga sp.]PWL29293.1 MAG: DUF4296 domain-containing protein [Roseivirga sp. XM-24bin3]
MAKKLFLLTVALFLFSCKSDDSAVPDGILTQEQMVDLLIDIRIAEGMVGSVSMGLDSADAVYKALEKRIFREHGVDSASYVKSYNYYLQHPKLYLDVTDIVIDSLKARNSKQFSDNY